MNFTTAEPFKLGDSPSLTEGIRRFIEARGRAYVLYEEHEGQASRPNKPLTEGEETQVLLKSMISEDTFVVVGDRSSYALIPIAKNELVLITGDNGPRPELGSGVRTMDASHLYKGGDWFDYLQDELTSLR